MVNENFIKYMKKKGKNLVSLFGIAETGTEFVSKFMQDYLDYKTIRKVTTESPTIDDGKYIGYRPEKFVEFQRQGRIFGYFDGDRKKSCGVGEGYLLDDIVDTLEKGKNVMLFPDIVELQNGFAKDYRFTDKIGFGFKTQQGIFDQAVSDWKLKDCDAIESAIHQGIASTSALMNYIQDKNDSNFNLLYVDGYGENIKENKIMLLRDVVGLLGHNPEDVEDAIQDYMSR